MTSTNLFDLEVENYVSALDELTQEFDDGFKNVGPSNSVRLSEEEELLLYDQPMLWFPQDMMTNAEAAQRLLVERGAVWYTEWVQAMERKRLRQQGAEL